jgi:hypothetical protein
MFAKKFFILSMVLMSHSAFATDKCFLMEESGVHRDDNNAVKNFKLASSSCLLEGKDVFILRELNFRGYDAKLVVNPQSLESHLVRNSCLERCSSLSNREISRTNYGTLLNTSDDGSYPLQNDGVTAGSSDRYVALTIDMCPSSKGISQNVYDELVRLSKQKGRAIPIGVAMTAAWQNRHRERFKWLKAKAREGRFKIQWINHSSHHRYKRDVPYEYNFMRKSGTDVVDEVLGNEISMLKGGVTPSVFFRFPGLVSSKALIRQISDWGLVALGTRAWFGKGEKAVDGSIILIHGNRNEPSGEVKFMDYVQTMDRHRHEFGSLYDVFYN